jgi:hypothetical protein
MDMDLPYNSNYAHSNSEWVINVELRLTLGRKKLEMGLP